MDPDGSRAFIACGPDNYVPILDLKTFAVTGHVEGGPKTTGPRMGDPTISFRAPPQS